MSEENKALMQQFIDGMNAQDPSFVGRFVAPNYVEHDPMPGQAPGAQGLQDMMQMFYAGFPDMKGTVNQIISEGDVVSVALTTTGTHNGDFMGIPATGKKISITEVHMVRIADGKMVEHWGLADGMTMMQQLGVMPEG